MNVSTIYNCIGYFLGLLIHSPGCLRRFLRRVDEKRVDNLNVNFKLWHYLNTQSDSGTVPFYNSRIILFLSEPPAD